MQLLHNSGIFGHSPKLCLSFLVTVLMRLNTLVQRGYSNFQNGIELNLFNDLTRTVDGYLHHKTYIPVMAVLLPLFKGHYYCG